MIGSVILASGGVSYLLFFGFWAKSDRKWFLMEFWCEKTAIFSSIYIKKCSLHYRFTHKFGPKSAIFHKIIKNLIFVGEMVGNGLSRHFCPRKLTFFRQFTFKKTHLKIVFLINLIQNRHFSIKQLKNRVFLGEMVGNAFFDVSVCENYHFFAHSHEFSLSWI